VCIHSNPDDEWNGDGGGGASSAGSLTGLRQLVRGGGLSWMWSYKGILEVGEWGRGGRSGGVVKGDKKVDWMGEFGEAMIVCWIVIGFDVGGYWVYIA
jgi:hypothetical protein